jgi:hypothetical protein
MGQNPPLGEFCLFPGFVLLALALIGFFLFLARRSDAGTTGVLFAGLGFLGSFGMSTPFHWLLSHLLPPFHAIRVPVRWTMVANLGFAVLAGLATATLVETWSLRRSRAFAMAFATTLCAAILFEDRVAPMYLHRGEPDPDPLTRHLKETSMTGGLYELPDEFGETNCLHVLRAADHWKPLVNGYSGFPMPVAVGLHDLLVEGKTMELLDALEAVPVSFVTVRPRRMSVEQQATATKLVESGLASRRLLYVQHFPPDDELYAVVRTEPGAKHLESASATNGPGGSAGTESADLTGSIDEPAERVVVTGPLAVRGWARIPGRYLDVTVLIDRVPRVPLREARAPRPGVQAAPSWIPDEPLRRIMALPTIVRSEENLDLVHAGVLGGKGVRELVAGGSAVAQRRDGTLQVPALRASARGERALLAVDENRDMKVFARNTSPAPHLELASNRRALGRIVQAARE